LAKLPNTKRQIRESSMQIIHFSIPKWLEMYFYEGLLYMMALLHCSGEFKIWSPKQSECGL